MRFLNLTSRIFSRKQRKLELQRVFILWNTWCIIYGITPGDSKFNSYFIQYAYKVIRTFCLIRLLLKYATGVKTGDKYGNGWYSQLESLVYFCYIYRSHTRTKELLMWPKISKCVKRTQLKRKCKWNWRPNKSGALAACFAQKKEQNRSWVIE